MKQTPRDSRSDEELEFDPQQLENEEYGTPEDAQAPEVDERTGQLTAWDEAPASSGTTAHKNMLDDEIPPGELLVEEGLDEADREQRIAAADPDFEP
jgi:hypothetical protein